MRVFKIFVVFAIALYLSLMAIFFFTQRSLLYYPNHSYVPLSEAHANKAFQEISVRTSDGLELRGWYAPATTKPFTIVFFHGTRITFTPLRKLLTHMSQPGMASYLRSTEDIVDCPAARQKLALYNDGRAYIRELIRRGVAQSHIIVFGHSLGTGVAVQIAQEFHVGGLMLLAPYLSVPKLARINFWFFPSSLLALDRFENDAKIGKVHVPVLIVNGDEDQVIPPAQGSRLFALANQPKEFHSLPGRGHNDAFGEFAPLSIDWIARACAPN